jgi:hypothetical protein
MLWTLPLLFTNDGNFTMNNQKEVETLQPGERINLLAGSLLYTEGLIGSINESQQLIAAKDYIFSYVEANFTLEATWEMKFFAFAPNFRKDFLCIYEFWNFEENLAFLDAFMHSDCLVDTDLRGYINLLPRDESPRRIILEYLSYPDLALSNLERRMCIDSFISNNHPTINYSWPADSLIQKMRDIAIPKRTYIRRCPVRRE